MNYFNSPEELVFNICSLPQDVTFEIEPFIDIIADFGYFADVSEIL